MYTTKSEKWSVDGLRESVGCVYLFTAFVYKYSKHSNVCMLFVLAAAWLLICGGL